MSQSAQGFSFNLADALTGQPEALPHFLERIRHPIIKAKTHTQDVRFAWRERGEYVGHFFFEHSLVDQFDGCGVELVFDERPQFRFFIVPDGGFE